MARKLLRFVGVAIGLLAAGIGALIGYAYFRTRETVWAPYPPIKADLSPGAIARGRAIFQVTCDSCHRAPNSARASGAPMNEVPAFLGSFHSANLTSHPLAGIGSARDDELARILRFGVSRDGRVTVMPAFAMGDDDVAAVLGFLRSDDPLFAPDNALVPPSEPTLVGRTVLLLSGALEIPERPAAGIPVPPKAPDAEYGRYVATAVYDCAGCHTAGFSPEKVQGTDAYAGGFEFRDPSGAPVLSTNITFHESGLGGWSLREFTRALRDGVRPDGTVVSAPMPRFRAADDVELEALYVFLRTLPKRPANYEPVHRPAPPAPGTETPEKLFAQLGCVSCHGPGAPYRTNLDRSAAQPADAVARFIRNPERFRPGTSMPTYEHLLDEKTALDLARWVQAGGAMKQP